MLEIDISLFWDGMVSCKRVSFFIFYFWTACKCVP